MRMSQLKNSLETDLNALHAKLCISSEIYAESNEGDRFAARNQFCLYYFSAEETRVVYSKRQRD